MTNPNTRLPAGRLGITGPLVSRLCLGTSAWSRAVDAGDPARLLDQVFEDQASSPSVTFIDTSNEYSGGLSEKIIGEAIRRHGGVPAGLVIQTKLDRDVVTGDFSGDRMLRSLDESLERLGLESFPMLFLHDPEHISFEAGMADGGPVAALVEMKRTGIAHQIGISGGPVGLLEQYVDTGLFDAVITHNRYTLVDRSAARLVQKSAERGIAVLNAAVYGGGALAKWPAAAEKYAYAPVKLEVAQSIAAMGAACQHYGIPLAAAALQWSTRNPQITSSIFGVFSAAQLAETIAMDALYIPGELWDELETLLPAPASWVEPPL